MPGKENINKPRWVRSVANDRMVRGYPSPKYFNLLRDFIDANEMNMSESISFILKDFFDKMDPAELTRLRDLAERQRDDDSLKIA